MKLFKSKYRNRIESKIKDLRAEIQLIEAEKAKIKQTLNPAEYCRLLVKEGNLSQDIGLLNSFLSN
jgi:hypothetical protein